MLLSFVILQVLFFQQEQVMVILPVGRYESGPTGTEQLQTLCSKYINYANFAKYAKLCKIVQNYAKLTQKS